MKPTLKHLERSIQVTSDNGKRLLEDATLLLDWDRFGTALALAVLAQEEFAKAFLLQLVQDDAVPWIPEVRRSMARHQCKHLLAVVMDWLGPFDISELLANHRRNEEFHEAKMAWLNRRIARLAQGEFAADSNDPEPLEPEVSFPEEIAIALNIYRHEEIERLKSGIGWRDPDWSKGRARDIADGALDRVKQAALYVDISRTGEIGQHPGQVTREQAAEAIEAATRLSEGAAVFSHEYHALKDALHAIFENLQSAENGS